MSLKDLKEIGSTNPVHLSVYALGFVGSVGPGLLIMYVFRHGEFIAFDTSKLLLLASAVSLPVIAALSIFFRLIIARELLPLKAIFLLAAIISSIGAYVAIAIAYYARLNFLHFAIIFLTMILVFVLLVMVLCRKKV